MKPALLTALALFFASPALAEPLDPDSVNAAGFAAEMNEENKLTPAMLRAQILLDRRGYSPGVIDGMYGDSTSIAIKAFQADTGLEPTGKLDEASFAKLVEGDAEPVLIRHAIAKEDVKGPFAKEIPEDIEDMAKLDRLAFTGPREALSERFHMDEDTLAQLNPGADFDKEGTEIVVAAVEGPEAAQPQEGRAATGPKAARVVVDKSERTLRVLGEVNELLAVYPASIGSEKNPAPTGELKVTRVAKDPTWNYDPKLKLEGEKDRPDRKMTVKAGPNNPVGAVWIDLSKEHFGIHGTPEPSKIGKQFSSGCVRLTNWDALELAGMVEKDTPVLFED